MAAAEQLGVSVGEQVDDRQGLALLGLRRLVGGDQLRNVGQVDRRLPRRVGLLVEVAHAALSEVPWMVLVEVQAVVVLATSVTATGLVLLMLANATIAAEGAATLVAGLAKTGRHLVTTIQKGGWRFVIQESARGMTLFQPSSTVQDCKNTEIEKANNL